MKSNKLLIIAVVGVFALCLAAIALIYTGAHQGTQVIISQNGQEIYRLDLDEDRELRIDAPEGGYNVVRVENGQISVTEADCPDQICVQQGKINDDAVPIVCLPHKLVIEVTAESDKDAVG